MSPEMFDYSMFPDLTGPEGAAIIGILIFYLIAGLLSTIWGIVVYVLDALGIYTIAKRRGIHHPWLAWLPVANVWILGSISDQYQYVAKGKIRNRRKTLLGLNIAVGVLLMVFLVAAAFVVVAAIRTDGNIESMVAPMIIYVASAVVMWILAMFQLVIVYIAYYDLFSSCNPDNAVIFLVLSIFFNFLLPFFVFASRKKDLGMPPRKIQVPVAPWTPAPPPPAPAWQNPPQPYVPAAPPAPQPWTPPTPWAPPVPPTPVVETVAEEAVAETAEPTDTE